MASRTVYGLDIEIDRSVDARDPAVAPIVKVAIAGPGFEEVFTGRERQLLGAVDDRLPRPAPRRHRHVAGIIVRPSLPR